MRARTSPTNRQEHVFNRNALIDQECLGNVILTYILITAIWRRVAFGLIFGGRRHPRPTLLESGYLVVLLSSQGHTHHRFSDRQTVAIIDSGMAGLVTA